MENKRKLLQKENSSVIIGKKKELWGGEIMLSYKPLWVTLARQEMNKSELSEKTKVGSATISKMVRNEPVNLSVLIKICDTLNVGLEDVVEYHPWDYSFLLTSRKACEIIKNQKIPVRLKWDYAVKKSKTQNRKNRYFRDLEYRKNTGYHLKNGCNNRAWVISK